jgi:hypothetical protein
VKLVNGTSGEGVTVNQITNDIIDENYGTPASVTSRVATDVDTTQGFWKNSQHHVSGKLLDELMHVTCFVASPDYVIFESRSESIDPHGVKNVVLNPYLSVSGAVRNQRNVPT